MRFTASIAATVLFPAILFAQVSSPPEPGTRTPAQAPAAPAQLAPAAVANSLPQVQQFIENTRVDLAKLRVEKWKTDSATKQQAQANIESIQRNMTSALPGIASGVLSNPASMAAAFKLYRNLNALYDVLSVVTETAGAFGPKDEYSALATDTANLDSLRRSIADQVELLAGVKDAEITRMQTQARQAAVVNTPPKKIVVDDNEPAKKPARKKKTPPKTE